MLTSILQVLDVVQEELDRGLATNTLCRQVGALATNLSGDGTLPLSQRPRVCSFLKGASSLQLPPAHRYLSWDLSLVLQALMSLTFEPLGSASLKLLTFKVSFLIAITSARCISELAALSVYKDLRIFHSDQAILRPHPTFIPKINTWAQEIILPDFCPKPAYLWECPRE